MDEYVGTMNSIKERQNTQQNIDRLAAQRCLYSTVKALIGFQIILSVPVVILLSLAASLIKSQTVYAHLKLAAPVDLSYMIAAYGVLLIAMDICCFSRLTSRLRQKAARIQESFDCNVFDIPWNKVLTGSSVDYETVRNWSRKLLQKKKNFDELLNWYPVTVSELSLDLGRLVCQRSNIRWDFELRKKYVTAINLCMLSLFILLLIISLFGDFSFREFITSVIAPFLPAFNLGMRLSYEHNELSSKLYPLKALLESTWEKALNSQISAQQLKRLSRQIQDGIYIHRSSAPPVFDWIYWLMRSAKEDEMNYSAAQLVDIARNRVQKARNHTEQRPAE